MFERLRRLTKGDSRYYAPMCPILFSYRFRFKLERLMRFPKGDNKDYAPMCPM